MNLLLLTKCYPYGNAEAFLENEIDVLSSFFNKIVIIACDVSIDEYMMRPLPLNVKAYYIKQSSKIGDLIRGLKNFFSQNEDIKDERKNASGIMTKLFLYYFEEKSQRIYKSIIEKHFLDELGSEPFILYSYWFFVTARVGTLIQNVYPPIYMFCRAHRYDLYEEQNRMRYLPYRRLLLKAYDQVFPCSESGTKYIKSHYPEYSGNVRTAYLGTLDYGVGRESIDGIFRIVSCSRLEPVKRVNKIIDVLQILDQKDLKIEWIHFGGGSELSKMCHIAEKKFRYVRYRFMGEMQNSDVMKVYQDNPFDLFINVSSSEGLPVSIMEAISFGIPTVATDVGGTREIVIDDVTGKLIPEDFCPEELAELIRVFICDSNSMVDRKSCRAFWKEHFMAKVNYYNLCEFVIKQCLSKEK